MISKRANIAIDCISLQSGASQGGAKLMVLSLLEQLPSLLAHTEITLLTAKYNHDELAYLDSANLHRICVLPRVEQSPMSNSLHKISLKTRVNQALSGVLSPNIVRKLKYDLRRPPPKIKQSHFDLYFSPFTGPHFYLPGIPLVSIIYDLQFLRYPEFFSRMEIFYRRQQFEDTWNLSTHIITISEFVRRTVLKNALIKPEKVSAIPIGLLQKFPSINMDAKKKLLHRLKLKPGKFLLYPANFWLHKNHDGLIDAFDLYLQRNPASELALVLPGDLDVGRHRVQAHVESIKRTDRIFFPGYLTRTELGVLYSLAKALIFPSLYEGFGMPLLEAMDANLPILCSKSTALPEVAGDAALFFDPRQPLSIVEAIEFLENNPTIEKALIRKGKERLLQFGSDNRMANAYASLFQMLLKHSGI